MQKGVVVGGGGASEMAPGSGDVSEGRVSLLSATTHFYLKFEPLLVAEGGGWGGLISC